MRHERAMATTGDRMSGIDAEIGRRLRTLRWTRGMTMEDVAARIGVRYQQIQKYETGANRLSANRLFQFAQVFGVSVGSFFENLEVGAEPGRAEVLLDRRSFRLAHEFDKLSEAQKTAVLSLVRSMAGEPRAAGRRDAS